MLIYICVYIFFSSFSYCDLIRPAHSQKLNYIHVVFEWDQEPNAETYRLQISSSEIFNSIIVDTIKNSNIHIQNQTINWDNIYFWRIKPIFSNQVLGNWSDVSTFIVSKSKIDSLNYLVLENVNVEDGLILVSFFQPSLQSVIIDKHGNEIWNDGDISLLVNNVNKHGNIFGYSNTDFPHNTGLQINMDLETIFNISPYEVDEHEFKKIENGNYMGLIDVQELGPIPSNNYQTDSFRDLGYEADGITPEIFWFGQKLVEWDINREIIWSWNPFDYFSLTDYDNYGYTWADAFIRGRYDWLHTNSFHFDSNESVIYLSFRHLSRISKISYPSGEVIWNMGPSEEFGLGEENICNELGFSYQHHIQLLPNGDLLFFDNGNLSWLFKNDEFKTSRIRRLKVVNNNYCHIVWEFELPHNLFGSGMGSVQNLDNGNYLLYTYGDGLNTQECSILELDSTGQILWKYQGDVNSAWYRAYKIPSLHPDIFSVFIENYSYKKIMSKEVACIIINSDNPSLDFFINNLSDFDESYIYSLFDENGTFNITIDTVKINAKNNHLISVDLENIKDSTNVSLAIWPINHEYAKKTKNYKLYISETDTIQINPLDFTVYNNFPNPFNLLTNLNYYLPRTMDVRILIYDLKGQLIKTILKKKQTNGTHIIQWDATNNFGETVASGLYFYNIEADDFSQTKKMIFLK